ncbi:hypothetical protein BH23CHL5_BH23CHL5_16050 [soil metagenome]
MTDEQTQVKTIDPRFSSLSEKQLELLREYVGDVVATDSSIEAALDRQLAMAKGDALMAPVAREFHDTVRDQRNAMISLRDAMAVGDDASSGNSLKEKGATVLGAVAGVIEKVRSEGLSKSLRDDYTSFSTASIGYTMLLTTAKAMGSADVAMAAERGLRTYASGIQKINQVMPALLITELDGDEGVVKNPAVADDVRSIINSVWKETDQSNGKH